MLLPTRVKIHRKRRPAPCGMLESPIGPLPINEDGLNRAVYVIQALKKENYELTKEVEALKAKCQENLDSYANQVDYARRLFAEKEQLTKELEALRKER